LFLIVVTLSLLQNVSEAVYYTNIQFFGTPVPAYLVAFFQAGGPRVLAAYGMSHLPSTDLYSQIVSKNQTLLQEKFGITNGLPFTYILQPMLARDPLNNILFNNFGVEDLQSHVVFNSLNAGAPAVRCDGLPTAKSLTQDCNGTARDLRGPVPATFPPRIRRGGDRRYKTMFGSLFDSEPNQQSALENFHTLGVKSIAIIYDVQSHVATDSSGYTYNAAAQLRISVPISLLLSTNQCDPNVPPEKYPEHCAPVEINREKAQTYSFDRRTPLSVALEIQAANIDALVFLSDTPSKGAWAVGELVKQMKKIGYSPKAVSCGGALPTEYAVYTDSPSDVEGWWQTSPWVRYLAGPQYKNVITETNFELFPADAGEYGPEKFARAYDAAYGPNRPGGGGVAHGNYNPDWENNVFAAIGYNSMIQMQKLMEKAGTRDVPSILAAAVTVSTPGVYHQVQFDQYGRTTRVNEMLLQRRNGGLVLLSPYNIGSPPVYPLPTWEERIFDPQFYSTTNERIMIAINSVCIALCVVLLAVVVKNWKLHVIRAATPSFCVVIILGGIFMLISNYFNTLVVNDAHCAASAWFLTLGFTMTFASLFIKTFRVWRIYARKNLRVLRMKDSQLLVAVGVFLLIDVIINAAWQGATGLKSEVIVIDEYRPQYNYTRCDYSSSMGAVYAHIAVKSAILLIGTVLTWVVRNVPTQFNESASMAAAIYNVSFIVCFIIPIIATDAGGRTASYLTRDFAIMFVVLATLGLLFFPKYMSSHIRNARAQHPVGGGANASKFGATQPTPPRGLQDDAGTVIERGSGSDPASPDKQTPKQSESAGEKEQPSERHTNNLAATTHGTAVRTTKQQTRTHNTTADDEPLPGTVEAQEEDQVTSYDEALAGEMQQSVRPVRPGERYVLRENPMSNAMSELALQGGLGALLSGGAPSHLADPQQEDELTINHPGAVEETSRHASSPNNYSA
jgi:hypothetical protein